MSEYLHASWGGIHIWSLGSESSESKSKLEAREDAENRTICN